MAELTENLIRLKTVHGVGNAILWRLLRHFGDSDRVLGATEADLVRVSGVTPDKARLILRAGEIDPRPEMEKAVQAGVDIIPYDDPAYPKPLLHSFDPPAVLYVRGRLAAEDQVAVGIVGTRRASSYGRDSALELSSALARGGYSIISGLARGVDTFAHIGAMNAGGRTVGVLGCGFDHMYPEENRDLALEMTQCGAVISEFPMATSPSRETFPTRNRIIAGMSLGLVVIEAPLRSGSLITARLANEIGRTVFAVPGRVGDAYSEGCNKLIRDGAVMVTNIDDIFNELNPSLPLPRFPVRSNGKTRAAKPRAETGKLFQTASEPDDGPEAAAASPAPRPKAETASPPAGDVTELAATKRAGPNPKLSPDQEAVLRVVAGDWQNIDDVIAASGVPAGKASAALAMLKLMRLIEQGPGQTYRLR